MESRRIQKGKSKFSERTKPDSRVSHKSPNKKTGTLTRRMYKTAKIIQFYEESKSLGLG